MAWINLRPTNTGGGRKRNNPTAKLYDSGQLVLSHATVALLGDPDRVRVSYEPGLQRIRLEPTTPGDNGGFSLSGGGNSQHRIGAKPMVIANPRIAVEYVATRVTGGIELRKKAEDD